MLPVLLEIEVGRACSVVNWKSSAPYINTNINTVSFGRAVDFITVAAVAVAHVASPDVVSAMQQWHPLPVPASVVPGQHVGTAAPLRGVGLSPPGYADSQLGICEPSSAGRPVPALFPLLGCRRRDCIPDSNSIVHEHRGGTATATAAAHIGGRRDIPPAG